MFLSTLHVFYETLKFAHISTTKKHFSLHSKKQALMQTLQNNDDSSRY